MRVSVILPVLYREPQLSETLEGLAGLRDRLDLEILLVVDVPDGTRAAEARSANDPIASKHGARALYRIGERGFGSALRRAFAEATGDVLVPMMADRSENPADVARLVEAIQQGWDIVSGSRYMRGGGIVGQTLKQRLSQAYSILCRLAGGPPIHDVSNAFKAYGRAVVESISTVSDSFDISVELAVKAYLAGFRVGEVPTVWTNRKEGRSHFSMRRELSNYGRWLLLAARSRRRAAGRSLRAAPPPSRAR
jgi:glycosyltransferase involved in cell wall biosynthesis